MRSLDHYPASAGKRHVVERLPYGEGEVFMDSDGSRYTYQSGRPEPIDEPWYTMEDAAEALDRATAMEEDAAYYADPELGADPEHAAALRWDARAERELAAKIQRDGAS